MQLSLFLVTTEGNLLYLCSNKLSLVVILSEGAKRRVEGSLYFVFAFAVAVTFGVILSEAKNPHFTGGFITVSNTLTNFLQKYFQNLIQIRIPRKGNPLPTFTTQFTTICPQKHHPQHPILPKTPQKSINPLQSIKPKKIQPIRPPKRVRAMEPQADVASKNPRSRR